MNGLKGVIAIREERQKIWWWLLDWRKLEFWREYKPWIQPHSHDIWASKPGERLHLMSLENELEASWGGCLLRWLPDWETRRIRCAKCLKRGMRLKKLSASMSLFGRTDLLLLAILIRTSIHGAKFGFHCRHIKPSLHLNCPCQNLDCRIELEQRFRGWRKTLGASSDSDDSFGLALAKTGANPGS